MIALGEILAWPSLERGGGASDQQSKHRWEQRSNHDYCSGPNERRTLGPHTLIGQ
jgi:hypothetical protein